MQELPNDILTLIIFKLPKKDQLNATIISKFFANNVVVFIPFKSNMKNKFVKYETFDRIQFYPPEINCADLDSLYNAYKKCSTITLLPGLKFDEKKKYYLNKCIINNSFFREKRCPTNLQINNLTLEELLNIEPSEFLLQNVSELCLNKCNNVKIVPNMLQHLKQLYVSNCSNITFNFTASELYASIKESNNIKFIGSIEFTDLYIENSSTITISNKQRKIMNLSIEHSTDIILDHIECAQRLNFFNSKEVTVKRITHCNHASIIILDSDVIFMDITNPVKCLYLKTPTNKIKNYPNAEIYYFNEIVYGEDMYNIEKYETLNFIINADKCIDFEEFYTKQEKYMSPCISITVNLELDNRNLRYINNIINPKLSLYVNDFRELSSYVNVNNCIMKNIYINNDCLSNKEQKIIVSNSNIDSINFTGKCPGTLHLVNCEIQILSINTSIICDQNKTRIKQTKCGLEDHRQKYNLPISEEIEIVYSKSDFCYNLGLTNCNKFICFASYTYIKLDNYPKIIVLSDSLDIDVCIRDNSSIRNEQDYYILESKNDQIVYKKMNTLISSIYKVGTKIKKIKKDLGDIADEVLKSYSSNTMPYRRSFEKYNNDGQIKCD